MVVLMASVSNLPVNACSVFVNEPMISALFFITILLFRFQASIIANLARQAAGKRTDFKRLHGRRAATGAANGAGAS